MVDKQVGICNGALLLLGANRISSFDEESTESIVCQDFYERSYRALLNIFSWKFAQKYTDLAIIPTVTPGDPQYKYAYQLPTDMIWLQHVLPNQDSYKVIGDQLHVNRNAISIKYTWRVQEELMPVLFEQTFMYYLASQMCLTLTEDTTKQQLMYTQYMDHLKRAKATDSQQQPQDSFADFPIDSARYGS